MLELAVGLDLENFQNGIEQTRAPRVRNGGDANLEDRSLLPVGRSSPYVPPVRQYLLLAGFGLERLDVVVVLYECGFQCVLAL